MHLTVDENESLLESIDGLKLRNQRNRRAPAALNEEMLTEIYSMLVRSFGVPPTEFEWSR